MSLLASQPREQWTTFLASLKPQQKRALLYKWRGWRARPAQLAPPGDWRCWLILAGRGFGKTRAGAEWIREKVESGECRRIGLIGETAADVRKVMVEGDSGLLGISQPGFRPEYEPAKRQLTWPNGAIATTYSGEEPDQLRGPQHDAVWADEPAKWRYATDAWDNMEFGLRLGQKPQVVATTTPRPIPLILDLVADPLTVVTTGSTYDNIGNLAPSFIQRVIRKYEGTRLGRQELWAEILRDVPGALWTRHLIEQYRLRSVPCPLVKIVVAVDPAVTSGEDADDTGIVVAGLGTNGHGYVVEDLTLRDTPARWAYAAIAAYMAHQADLIVAEVNNGGELVETVIHQTVPYIPYKAVHASRGKRVRAEPISTLYERGMIHHVGVFPELEDQMVTFVPDQEMRSPDRMDALVWAFTELFVEPEEVEGTVIYDDRVVISPY